MFSKTDIEKYFIGEKQEALLFLVIGILAVLIAAYLFFAHKGIIQKGIAVPLLIFGLLQAIIGYSIYTKSDKQRIDLVYAYDMNPNKITQEELPRITKVNSQFRIILIAEVVFLIAGIVLIFLYRNQPAKAFLFGVGIGLLLQAAVLLVADLIAVKRNALYGKQLRTYRAPR